MKIDEQRQNARSETRLLRIGLTGGIGSGKSVVSERFEKLGVPVIDTDVIARDLTAPESPALAEIARAFGRDMMHEGKLDRERLRRLVFSQDEARRRLEEILHPRIRAEVERRTAALTAPYCVVVVPLMVETDFQDTVDRILVVSAPQEKRMQWLEQRDGLGTEDIERIFSAQATDRQREAIADDIIYNDSNIEALLRQVDELHRRYSRLASARPVTPKRR